MIEQYKCKVCIIRDDREVACIDDEVDVKSRAELARFLSNVQLKDVLFKAIPDITTDELLEAIDNVGMEKALGSRAVYFNSFIYIRDVKYEITVSTHKSNKCKILGEFICTWENTYTVIGYRHLTREALTNNLRACLIGSILVSNHPMASKLVERVTTIHFPGLPEAILASAQSRDSTQSSIIPLQIGADVFIEVEMRIY